MAFTSDGSIFCKSDRAVHNMLIDANFTLPTNAPMIIAIGILGVTGDRMRAATGSLTLWWRRVGGTFAAISSTGEIKIAQTASYTVLVNGTGVTLANGRARLSPTFISGAGVEVEATASGTAAALVDIRDIQSGEWQFAIDLSGAVLSQQYEFKAVIVQDVANADITYASLLTTAATAWTPDPAPQLKVSRPFPYKPGAGSLTGF